MPNWRDDFEPLGEGRFRGAPFSVVSRIREGGRRGPTHEFPQQDIPDGEDTGRKLRRFQVTAVVVGDAYRDILKRLLSALEEPGPGTYEDPWGESHKVIARSHTVTEGRGGLGFAELSLTFEEAGEEQFPRAAINTSHGLETAAEGLENTAQTAFDTDFDLTRLPGWVADAAEVQGLEITNAVRRVLDSLPALNPLAFATPPDPRALLDSLAADLPARVRGAIGGDLVAVFREMAAGYAPRRKSVGAPRHMLAASRSLSTFGAGWGLDNRVTPSRRAEADNGLALRGLVRNLALAGEARSFAATPWESYDEALNARDGLLTRIDGAQKDVGGGLVWDDGRFDALSSMADAVLADTEARAGPLPRLRRLVLTSPEPALVVAHRYLGNAKLSDDLLTRNASVIIHPGSLPVGVPLEVLMR